MKEIFDAQIVPNKELIYRQMKISKNSKIYEIIESKFDRCLMEIEERINFQNLIIVKKNSKDFGLKNIAFCEKVVFCFSTIGKEIISWISNKFSDGEYVDGYIINEIANFYVMEATNQMYSYIKNELKKSEYNMTIRFSPGECGMPLWNQKIIMEELQKEFSVNGKLTESFMISPEKSILFFYGADRNIEELKIDFDCSKCNAKDCAYKR